VSHTHLVCPPTYKVFLRNASGPRKGRSVQDSHGRDGVGHISEGVLSGRAVRPWVRTEGLKHAIDSDDARWITGDTLRVDGGSQL
jgi:hypothetical protein